MTHYSTCNFREAYRRPLLLQPADGSGPAEALLKAPYDQFPQSVGRDGTVLYTEINPKTSRDMLMLSPDGKTTPLRITPANEGEARFWPGTFSGSGSAKGWIAYASDESGRREVYVQSYPGAANRIPVTREGGSQPRWSRDGKELFYVTGGARWSPSISIRTVPSERRAGFLIGPPSS